MLRVWKVCKVRERLQCTRDLVDTLCPDFCCRPQSTAREPHQVLSQHDVVLAGLDVFWVVRKNVAATMGKLCYDVFNNSLKFSEECFAVNAE